MDNRDLDNRHRRHSNGRVAFCNGNDSPDRAAMKKPDVYADANPMPDQNFTGDGILAQMNSSGEKEIPQSADNADHDDGISDQANHGNAHARGELTPQAHGGALRPLKTGQKMTGWKTTRRAAFRDLQQMTPASIARVRQMVESDDERVSLMAIIQVLDRTLGKPGDMPQGDDDGGSAADLSSLSPSDRIRLSAALATVKRLTGRGPGALPLTQPMNGKIVDV